MAGYDIVHDISGNIIGAPKLAFDLDNECSHSNFLYSACKYVENRGSILPHIRQGALRLHYLPGQRRKKLLNSAAGGYSLRYGG